MKGDLSWGQTFALACAAAAILFCYALLINDLLGQ